MLRKLVLVGLEGAGKSSIFNKIQDVSFNENLRPSTGLEFGVVFYDQKSEAISNSDLKNRDKIKLQIWDLTFHPGQSNEDYLKNTDIIVLVINPFKATKTAKSKVEWIAKSEEELIDELNHLKTELKKANYPREAQIWVLGTHHDLDNKDEPTPLTSAYEKSKVKEKGVVDVSDDIPFNGVYFVSAKDDKETQGRTTIENFFKIATQAYLQAHPPQTQTQSEESKVASTKPNIQKDKSGSPGIKTIRDIEGTKITSEIAKNSLELISSEIKRVNFHPGLGKYWHSSNEKNFLDSDDIKKHLTTTIKSVFNDIHGTESKQKDYPSILKQVRERFRAARENFSFARSDVSETFYASFENPVSAWYAKDTLEQLLAGDGCVLLPITKTRKQGIPFSYQKRKVGDKTYYVSPLTAKIVDLYQKASNYQGITWEGALRETEVLLANAYKEVKDPKKLSEYERQDQEKFNKAFSFIQNDYHAQLTQLTRVNDTWLKDDRQFGQLLKFEFDSTNTRWNGKNSLPLFNLTGLGNRLHLGGNSKDIVQLVKDKLLDLDKIKDSDPGKRAAGLAYLAYHLFIISREIPLGYRNSDNLYQAIMKKIGNCLGMDTNAMDSKKVRVAVETFMEENIILFEKRALCFQSENLVKENTTTYHSKV